MVRPRALFLDRDGIINEDRGYVHRAEDFVFIEPIFELCRRMSQADFRIVVCTNQSGIARGLFEEADFTRLTEWMLDCFRKQGLNITAVYHCPFHPQGLIEEFKRESDWRKPSPGMLLEAAREHDLDLSRSVIIGDSARDVQAGLRAGLRCRVQVTEAKAGDAAATLVVPSLQVALAWFQGALQMGRL